MLRFLFIIVAIGAMIAFIVLIIQWMSQSNKSVRCSKCEGKGFWLGARGREKCDWCNGTGRLQQRV